ncbi:Vitamin B12 transporter BtuB [Usitatibacter rugosus]|uniref:Vitamin B12 transporter BtuB n=1 Tax=Usitatibacter rugosus TaxID=2732067 RepID=A0A6M4GRD2_9PROT|nr:TonB-dependent receptor [Usitatibacter rugosus]QJR09910.1 Vitamin B12 transporter BtuB [Usitatibacter rugosus]
MMVRRKALAIATANAFGMGCALLAVGDVQAQQAQKVEKIEVTGSNIKRSEGEGALPVTVITREEIDRSGATTPIELLNLVSANNSAGNVSLANVIGSLSFSAQTASLRGLGGGRTLVLVNGKRMDSFAGEIQGVQGVNLSSIPFSAIERVEILKDGASAVYGSDAIAGVINFILRQDYQGAEVMAYYGAPTRGGGGEITRVNAAAGFGNLSKDRYNVLLTVSNDIQKPLDQNKRNFSNTSFRPEINLAAISSNTFPGLITTGGIGVPGSPNNCAPSTYLELLGGCFYDPSAQPGVQMITDNTQWNVFASGRVELGSGLQAYATGIFSRLENQYRIQPVPISSLFPYGPRLNISSAITLQPTSPFYPHGLAAEAGVDGQPLDVRWRAYENGLRDTTDTNENAQMNVGLKGAWRTWDWDASYTYAEGHTKQKLNGGFPNLDLLLPLLRSGRVNLFGPNTPEISREILATNYNGETFNATSKNQGIQGRMSGEIYQMKNGPISLAFGAEYRKESLDQNPAPVLAGGTIAGFGGNVLPVSSSRDVTAFYGELNIPVLKDLEVNVAVRNDHYSDFGSTTNPKASIRYNATPDVLLRASYGKGFLAPSLYQLNTPRINGVTPAGQTDPVRCPVTNDTGLDCSTQFGVLFGGTKDLKPETSEQTTLGVVYSPSTQFSVGADYFKIRLNDVITNGIPFTTILGDQDQFGYLIARDPPDAAYPNLPGHISQITQVYLNLGAVHIEGFDLEAHATWPATRFGRVKFDITGTYYRRQDAQNLDGSYTGFVSNTFGARTTGVVPRWKHYASLSLDNGPWQATLGTSYQSSYIDAAAIDDEGTTRRVSTLTLWDLQGAYKGFKNWTFVLGVKNLMDTDPPVTNQPNSFQVGFDPSYYDPRGRFVYGSVTWAFR